jgi:hypothetical protein
MKRTVFALTSLLPALVAGAAGAAPLELSGSLGMGKPSGDGSEDFSLDVGGAVALGARFHPNFSLRGRLSADRLGPDDPPLGDASMWMGRLQLEPAGHVLQDRIDFSLGPTFGLYYLSGEFDGPGPADLEANSRGFSIGVRVELLFRPNADVAVGPYFSYDRLLPTKTCLQVGTMTETCDDDPDNDQGFWQLGAAVTF